MNKETKQLLELFARPNSDKEFISFHNQPSPGGFQQSRTVKDWLNGSDKELSSWINKGGLRIGLGIHNGSRPTRRTAVDHSGWRAHMIEYDNGTSWIEQKKLISKFGIKPSAIIHTGNKSFHIIWVTDNLVSEAQWRANQNALVAAFPGSDPQVNNPAISTRVPGSIHMDTKRKASLKLIGRRINNKVFQQALGSPVPIKKHTTTTAININDTTDIIAALEKLDCIRNDYGNKFNLTCIHPECDDHDPSAVFYKISGRYYCMKCRANLDANEVRAILQLSTQNKLIIKPTCNLWIKEWLDYKSANFDYKTNSIILGKSKTPEDYDLLLKRILSASEKYRFSMQRIEAELSLWLDVEERKALNKIRSKVVKASTKGGKEELLKFLKACTGKENKLTYAVMRHWIWQIKRKLLELPVEHHMMPIFQGPTGAGKSMALEKLIGPMDAISISGSFQDLVDERCWFKFKRYYIHINEELNGAAEKDVGKLKDTITKKLLNWRILGLNRDKMHLQNATFVGTCNPKLEEIIKDRTSARRFWEVRCIKNMDWDTINKIDYELLWTCVSPFDKCPVNKSIDKILIAQDKELRYKDTYENFIKDCITYEENAFISVEDLYQRYRGWAYEQDMKVSQRNTVLKGLKRSLLVDSYSPKWIGKKTTRGYKVIVNTP